jgi:hypothetical protein
MELTPVPLTVNVPPVDKLPELTVPVTVRELKVPTLVILGWALVVTVAAVVDDPEDTAYVALATVPVTLAPGIEVNPVAAP